MHRVVPHVALAAQAPPIAETVGTWSEPVNWQPISQMSLVAGMIDCALSGTRDHTQTLTKAPAQSHVFDDATIDRIERVHREQLEFVDNYAEQIQRWRTEGRPLSKR